MNPRQRSPRAMLSTEMTLLLFALGRDGLHRRFDLLRVAQIVVLDRLEGFVQSRRPAGRRWECSNRRSRLRRCCRDTSPARAGCCHAPQSTTRLPDFTHGRDGLVPERKKARDGVFQALGERQFGRAETQVTRVVARATRIVDAVQRRRRDVVAPAPDLHLRARRTWRPFRTLFSPCSAP